MSNLLTYKRAKKMNELAKLVEEETKKYSEYRKVFREIHKHASSLNKYYYSDFDNDFQNLKPEQIDELDFFKEKEAIRKLLSERKRLIQIGIKLLIAELNDGI